MDRSQHFAILLLAIALLGLFTFTMARRFTKDSPSPVRQFSTEGIKYVQICGNNISRPGVYSFYYQPALEEVLALAGSLRDHQLSAVELKRPVKNGSKIVLVDRDGVGRVQIFRMNNAERLLFGIPMPLNSVSQPDLELLPGIGPALASRVLEYRSKVGRFESINELRNVEGIGEAKFREISPHLSASEMD